jgi:hypothetical protein
MESSLFLRIAEDAVLVTLVAATIIEGIGYLKFLWNRMTKGK